MNKRVLKSLSQSFTHRDNPYGHGNSNIAFQRDLDEMLEADAEYQDNPSLARLCYLVADLINQWEKLEMKSRRISGSTSTQSSSDKGKHSRVERGRHRADDTARGLPTSHCEGCNRDNHKREDCKFRNHPDFNERGQKQLYFFSGFNSGPVYHLRVVEQKFSFVLNLSKLNLSFVLFASL